MRVDKKNVMRYLKAKQFAKLGPTPIREDLIKLKLSAESYWSVSRDKYCIFSKAMFQEAMLSKFIIPHFSQSDFAVVTGLDGFTLGCLTCDLKS